MRTKSDCVFYLIDFVIVFYDLFWFITNNPTSVGGKNNSVWIW